MIALTQFVDVMKKTQWWPADELAAYQRKPLGKLLRHAYETVPFYRDRLAILFHKDGSIGWDRWEEVPLLTRKEIQDHSEDLVSSVIPDWHGGIHKTQSSGTTGSPIEVRLTMLHEVARGAACVRLFDWHGIDRRGSLATIRPLSAGEAVYPEGERVETWPEFADHLSECGPFIRLNSNTPIDLQAEWVARNKPDYLLTLASNAGALAAYIENNPEVWEHVNLKRILSYAEIVSHDIRERCRNAFGLEVIDCYSARECGYIALQCPVCTHYHAQDEVIRTEVLDVAGGPCQPGDSGRVIVTPLLAGVVTEEGKAKYTGMHTLRHFYASALINPKEQGGQELQPKVVQERMGHSTLAMSMDVYGHLFPSRDDPDAMQDWALSLVNATQTQHEEEITEEKQRKVLTS